MSSRFLTAQEQGFFARFFTTLDRREVPYILLRNYETFPAEIGHDLDVFFPSGRVDDAIAVFLELLDAERGQLFHVHRRSYFVAVWFSFSERAEEALHIDFYHGAYTWHGLPYLEEEELLSQKRLHQEHPIPRPAHEAYSLVLASLLWGGFFKQRYAPRIKALLSCEEETNQYQACFQRAFGSQVPFEWLQGSELEIKRLARSLRKQLKRRSFISEPFFSFLRLANYWISELHTLIAPPGLHVALIMSENTSCGLDLAKSIQGRVGELFGNSGEGEVYTLTGGENNWRILKRTCIAKAKNALVISILSNTNTAAFRWKLGFPDLVIDGTGNKQDVLASKGSPWYLTAKRIHIKNYSIDAATIDSIECAVLDLLREKCGNLRHSMKPTTNSLLK